MTTEDLFGYLRAKADGVHTCESIDDDDETCLACRAGEVLNDIASTMNEAVYHLRKLEPETPKPVVAIFDQAKRDAEEPYPETVDQASADGAPGIAEPEGGMVRYELKCYWNCSRCDRAPELYEDDGLPNSPIFELHPGLPLGWVFRQGKPVCDRCKEKQT